MRILLANVRFTLRLIRRSPGFYALVLLLLTAGIGTTTAMFSVTESVILKPLPYDQAEDLTDVFRLQLGRLSSVSAANFVDWKAQGTTFEQMAAASTAQFSLSSPGSLPASVQLAGVTGDFFPMLRLKPLVGRLFGPDDDRPGAPLVCVISAQLWRERFASDPAVIGRTIMLNSRPHTVIGVAPPGFVFASSDAGPVAVWRPYFGSESVAQYADQMKDRGLNELQAMGRRRHGVSLAQAQAQMTAVAENLDLAYPDANAKTGITLQDLHDALVGDRSRSIGILFAAVLLVFLVVTANVASVLLARSQTRRGELATRTALGASSSAVLVQLVTETVVLFGIAGLLGTALASLLVSSFAAQLFAGTSLQAAVSVRLDTTALLAGIVVSLLVGVAAGAGPAFVLARVDPAGVLKQASVRAGSSKSHARIRSGLVVAQIALAFALLTGSGLALKSFVALLRTPPGFDPSGVATAEVDLPGRTYDSDDKSRAFLQRALDAIGALPGVEAVSATHSLPMSQAAQALTFDVEGHPPWPPGEAPALGINFVGPRYLEVMRIPVLEGRGITAADTASSRPIIVLTKQAARLFFPGEDPIGRRLRYGSGDDWREIVGIAGDVRKEALGEPPDVDGYTPFTQTVDHRIFFVMRTGAPEAVLAAMPRLVQGLDPELAVSGLEMMQERVSATVGEPRRIAALLVGFALAALVLATLGLFGLVSYTTAERTRELGIRLALGSPPESVLLLVMSGAMKLVLVGLAVGLVLSVWAARQIASTMPGAVAMDLAVLAPVPLLLGLAGLVAALIPALRALRTPPASALRYE